MDFYISNLNVWYPHCESVDFNLQTITANVKDFIWPKLDFVPAMQRRRLSPFAKIALYVADASLKERSKDIAIIFSSRHGDLHKTSKLIEDLSNKQALSPTAFGLSVHNAVPSLYSILIGNKQAINAIVSGKDTFFMSLVDAYARLKSGACDEILFIHTDQDLPDVYLPYQDEVQIPHAFAMIIKLKPELEKEFEPKSEVDQARITCTFTSLEDGSVQDSSVLKVADLPSALDFYAWLNSDKKETNYRSEKYCWNLTKT